jgi:hypothetical protein
MQYSFIWGRSDSVKVTANIYIEDIKYCLEHSFLKNRLDGHFKYGTQLSKNGKEQLKILVFLKSKPFFTKKEQKLFEKEFYDNLLKANNDFKMIQSGIQIETFHFDYELSDPEKYRSYKLKYFF